MRVIHSIFAVYFIACIIYVYYAAITLKISLLLGIALFSLLLEGFLVFILNGGHCPLIYIQRRVNDPVPFFNLFLPDDLAKKAIPFFTILTFLAVIVLILRLVLSANFYKFQ